MLVFCDLWENLFNINILDLIGRTDCLKSRDHHILEGDILAHSFVSMNSDA